MPSGFDQAIIAYRTVPATRQNLVPGAIVIGLQRGALPISQQQAFEAFWYYGVLQEANVDAGVYQLQDFDDTLPLEGARVAVIAWKPGEKIQILGNKRRDQLAVKPGDVFLPPKN